MNETFSPPRLQASFGSGQCPRLQARHVSVRPRSSCSASHRLTPLHTVSHSLASPHTTLQHFNQPQTASHHPTIAPQSPHTASHRPTPSHAASHRFTPPHTVLSASRSAPPPGPLNPVRACQLTSIHQRRLSVLSGRRHGRFSRLPVLFRCIYTRAVLKRTIERR